MFEEVESATVSPAVASRHTARLRLLTWLVLFRGLSANLLPPPSPHPEADKLVREAWSRLKACPKQQDGSEAKILLESVMLHGVTHPDLAAMLRCLLLEHVGAAAGTGTGFTLQFIERCCLHSLAARNAVLRGMREMLEVETRRTPQGSQGYLAPGLACGLGLVSYVLSLEEPAVGVGVNSALQCQSLQEGEARAEPHAGIADTLNALVQLLEPFSQHPLPLGPLAKQVVHPRPNHVHCSALLTPTPTAL